MTETLSTPPAGEKALALWEGFDSFTRITVAPFCSRNGVVNPKAETFLATVLKAGLIALAAFTLYQIWKNPILSLVCFISGALVRFQPETINTISTKGYDFFTSSLDSIRKNETFIEKGALLATFVVIVVYGISTLLPPAAASTYIGSKISRLYMPKEVENFLDPSTITDQK